MNDLDFFEEAEASDLNLKQLRFCHEFVIDNNATQAYIRAGYAEAGAAQNASTLMRNYKVVQKVALLQKQKMQALSASADFVISELLDNHQTAKQEGKLSDSNKALELLGRRHKLFTDKLEHSGSVEALVHTSGEMSLEEATRIYEDNVKSTRD